MISSGAVSFGQKDGGSSSSGDALLNGCKVILEQKLRKESPTNFADMQAMIDRAMSGLSAHTFIDADCPVALKTVDGDAEVSLVFFVLKSHDDIEVTLEVNGGELTDGGKTLLRKEQSVIFGLSNHVDFDFQIKEVTAVWESKILDTAGNILNEFPIFEIKSTSVFVPKPIFGVARMTMSVPADQYMLKITIPKSSGYKVSNIKAVVTAYWPCEDELSSTSLTLEIPQCVYDQLATCEDGKLKNGGAMKTNGMDTAGQKPVTTQVYYNTCDGSILGTRHV